MSKKKQLATGSMTLDSALAPLDEMEPGLRHLDGLMATFRILGEADDSIEPIVVSSLARCANETLEELKRNWRTSICALRER